jgi:hypothetical protein
LKVSEQELKKKFEDFVMNGVEIEDEETPTQTNIYDKNLDSQSTENEENENEDEIQNKEEDTVVENRLY